MYTPHTLIHQFKNDTFESVQDYLKKVIQLVHPNTQWISWDNNIAYVLFLEKDNVWNLDIFEGKELQNQNWNHPFAHSRLNINHHPLAVNVPDSFMQKIMPRFDDFTKHGQEWLIKVNNLNKRKVIRQQVKQLLQNNDKNTKIIKKIAEEQNTKTIKTPNTPNTPNTPIYLQHKKSRFSTM